MRISLDHSLKQIALFTGIEIVTMIAWIALNNPFILLGLLPEHILANVKIER